MSGSQPDQIDHKTLLVMKSLSYLSDFDFLVVNPVKGELLYNQMPRSRSRKNTRAANRSNVLDKLHMLLYTICERTLGSLLLRYVEATYALVAATVPAEGSEACLYFLLTLFATFLGLAALLVIYLTRLLFTYLPIILVGAALLYALVFELNYRYSDGCKVNVVSYNYYLIIH